MTTAQTISITLAPHPARSYDVVIGAGVLSTLGARAAELTPGRRAFVVVDDGLPAPTRDVALASLRAAGFTVTTQTLHPSETNKTIDTASRLLHAIGATAHERRDPVVALGGGVTGDIAGFVAAIWRRGVPVIQCPTTLLAMVDASVGGKTGVNIASGPDLRKNMVGVFWQPSLVLSDVSTLASLPERYLRAGLAECLKHGLISHATDPDLFAWTNSVLVKCRMGDQALLTELVARNVRVKASFVQGDEREEKPSSEGGRALLNLGHTFGHAIETLERLSPDGLPENAPLQHGEAVAFGLVAAAATSHATGSLSEADRDAVRIAVERLGLESRLIGLPGDDELMAAMAHDKKVLGGRLRLVLPVALGRSVIVEAPDRSAVGAGWDAIRARRA